MGDPSLRKQPESRKAVEAVYAVKAVRPYVLGSECEGRKAGMPQPENPESRKDSNFPISFWVRIIATGGEQHEDSESQGRMF